MIVQSNCAPIAMTLMQKRLDACKQKKAHE